MTAGERIVLDRFLEKTRIAGGARTGYVLRKAAILFVGGDHPGVDLEAALTRLVERDLLKVNDSGNFYFLTAAGAEQLGAEATGCRSPTDEGER
ncbi:MAG: hypothetical protein OES47_12200 [Acidobacteriota bacterium]|nr:hypothetical protein [Acidobacteriota bacterium]